MGAGDRIERHRGVWRGLVHPRQVHRAERGIDPGDDVDGQVGDLVVAEHLIAGGDGKQPGDPGPHRAESLHGWRARYNYGVFAAPGFFHSAASGQFAIPTRAASSSKAFALSMPWSGAIETRNL